MVDPSFCSACLICTKFCVHPKARLELNDVNSPTISRSTSVTGTGGRNLKQKISSFAECVSKFCELFNSPVVPGDNSFQKDFNEFFKFTTLSSNCPVCEDCQQRIRLISKVMIQIESLQAQLIELKKSVVKDLSVPISAENGSSKHVLNNKMKFFINCGVETRLFREKLKEKLQTSSAGSNAVDINDVDSALIPEINSYLQNNEKFFTECGRKTKLFRERLQEKLLQIASTGANKAVHANDVIDSTMIPNKINQRNTDVTLNHGVADTETPFQLNDDCLSSLCDDFVMKPGPRPSNEENVKDGVDDSIDIPICGVSSDDEDEEIPIMEVTKGKKKLGRHSRPPRRIHWRQLKVNDVCFPNASTEEEAQGTVTVVKTKPESLKKRDDDDDYLPESESSSEDQPEESTAGSSDDSHNDGSSHSTGSSTQNHSRGSKSGGSWSSDARKRRSKILISSSSDDESPAAGPLTAKNATARPAPITATHTTPRPGPSTPTTYTAARPAPKTSADTIPQPGPSTHKTATPRPGPGPGRGKGGKKRKRGRPPGKSLPLMLHSDGETESMVSSCSGSECGSDSEGDQPNPAKRKKKKLSRRRKAEKRRRQCF